MSDHRRDAEAAAERLRLALELYEAGERMMVQEWRRESPDLSDAEIEDRLRAWLQERPGGRLPIAVEVRRIALTPGEACATIRSIRQASRPWRGF